MPDYVVGKSRVFIRKQLVKILFDEFRDSCSANVVVPIQRVARGFLARLSVMKRLGESKKRHQEDRKREAVEKTLMHLEDELSLQQELIFRSDKDLQRKLYEARQQRAKEERAKIQSKRLAAAVLIQKIVRGFVQRRKSDVYLCERLCEISLQSRDEQLMEKALQRCKELGNRAGNSKLIVLYRKSIKTVILELMNEKYVVNTLQEATQIRSIPLLTAAIELARDNNMLYLPEVAQAGIALHELSNLRVILKMLHDELSKCNNMSNFMRKYDIVQYLIGQAFRYDLHGEKIVVEASTRIAKIENLFKLRQSLRHALEICSPTKMIRSMRERAKYLKLFSEGFLDVEAGAIEKMMHMLTYKQTLLTPFLQQSLSSHAQAATLSGRLDELSLHDDDPVAMDPAVPGHQPPQPPQAEEDLKRLNMHEIYHLVIHANPAASAAGAQEVFQTIRSLSELSPQKLVSGQSADQLLDDKDFIYLPRFVREPLGRMREATNEQGNPNPNPNPISFISNPNPGQSLTTPSQNS